MHNSMGQPLQQFADSPQNYWGYSYNQPGPFVYPQGTYQGQPMTVPYAPAGQHQASISAQPLGAEAPQVSIEINLILNDQNLPSLTSKIPFLRILVDKGIIGGSLPPNRPIASPIADNVTLGKRPNPPEHVVPAPAPQAVRPSEPKVPVFHQEPPINESGGGFTQLKDEIDKILDKEINSNVFQPLGQISPYPGTTRGGQPAGTGDERPARPFSNSKNDTPIRNLHSDPNKVFSSTNGQFSFQKMTEGSDYSNGQPGQPSFRFFSNRKHLHDVDAVKLEMEKICQNQSRTIRGFWENRQEPQPYIFKQKSLAKSPENPDGIITEKVDFSNKRIAEGDSHKMSAEHSRESEGEEASEHSGSNNNSS